MFCRLAINCLLNSYTVCYFPSRLLCWQYNYSHRYLQGVNHWDLGNGIKDKRSVKLGQSCAIWCSMKLPFQFYKSVFICFWIYLKRFFKTNGIHHCYFFPLQDGIIIKFINLNTALYFWILFSGSIIRYFPGKLYNESIGMVGQCFQELNRLWKKYSKLQGCI